MMMLLVFLIFAGCAVKCDDANNYYVIERPSDDPIRGLKPFQVYWNVPSMQCRSKKIPFESLYKRYGIIQNNEDNFQGEQITILYDPGLFPAILKDDSTGKLKFRNGGVPQEGNLDEHLTAFRYVVDHTMPDPEYNGIAIIDFESWRPVFRQNFGELTPYKNMSLLIERKLHPWWSRAWVEAEAKSRFERAGREFMQATLSLAKLLRPNARWGYYGFPYCFNMASNNLIETCPNKVRGENDQISWLWSESTALFPSVYSSRNLTSSQLASLIRGRVAEGARVGRGVPILPYFWFRYRDDGYMTETDLKLAVQTLYKSSAAGFIIWGSSNDVNTVTKCEKLQNYLEQVLGPVIAQYTKRPSKDVVTNKVVNETTFNITTENPFDVKPSDTKNETVVALNNTNDLNHVFKRGESNDNSTENTSHKLVDEIIVNETNINKGTEQNNGILIDILLSIVENVQKSGNKEFVEKEMEKINKDRKKGTLLHDSFTKLTKEDYDLSTEKYANLVTKKGNIFTKLFTTNATPEINNFTETIPITSTTYYKDESSTTEVWYDNNFYNENTFTDQTPVTDESTDILEDDLFDVELNDEPTEIDNYTGITTESTKISTDITETISTATEGVSTTDGTISTMGEVNDSLGVASQNQVVMSVV